MMLRNKNMDLSGRVLLVRAGKNSFAEKVRDGNVAITFLSFSCFLFTLVVLTQVANAARLNASALLIYPDPADYFFDENTELFGHVSEHCLVAWGLKRQIKSLDYLEQTIILL